MNLTLKNRAAKLSLSAAVALVTMAMPAGASAQLQMSWASRYSEHSFIAEAAKDVVADSAGNAYVTGKADNQCVTIKYGPSGSLRWVARYWGNPLNSGGAAGHKVALDGDGNVLVAGFTASYGPRQCVVLKYDSNGTQLWESRFDTQGDPTGLETDHLGNVYVLGAGLGRALMKLDGNGNELWALGSVGTYDFAVDSGGNAYVTQGTAGYARTCKVDPNGIVLWTAEAQFSDGTGWGRAAIALDANGNPYVTCGSRTTKYDTEGNEQWFAIRPGPVSNDDIAVDADGDVFVSGTAVWHGNGDYAVTKFGPQGAELWTSYYDNQDSWVDVASGLVLKPSGDAVVTGNSRGLYEGDHFTTVQFDGETGQIVWVDRYLGLGLGAAVPVSIAMDPFGNVYVTGSGQGQGQFDWLTIKYEANGDIDADGLSNLDEVNVYHTDPNVADTDGDLLIDGAEVNTHHTNPLVGDTDGDGLLDGTEVDMAHGTGCPSPLNPDSDGDGLSDGAEVALGTSPCNPDTDVDGVNDAQDPTPLTPGVPGGWIENAIRNDAAAVLGFSLTLIDAPNANAAAGRRNALSTAFTTAANLVAQGNRQAAISELSALLGRLDGDPSPPDWMVDGPEKSALYYEVQLMIYLLGLP